MKPWGPYLLNDLKCDHPQEKGNFGVDMCTTHSYSKTKEACFNTKQTRQPISILHHKMEIKRLANGGTFFISGSTTLLCSSIQDRRPGTSSKSQDQKEYTSSRLRYWYTFIEVRLRFQFSIFFKVSPSEEATRPQGNNDHYFIALIRTQAKNALQWNGPEFGCNCSPHFQW